MFSEVYEVMARRFYPVTEEKSKKDSGYQKVLAVYCMTARQTDHITVHSTRRSVFMVFMSD